MSAAVSTKRHWDRGLEVEQEFAGVSSHWEIQVGALLDHRCMLDIGTGDIKCLATFHTLYLGKSDL